MRLTVFFLYLFFHLQSGGNYVHAASHDNSIYSCLMSKFEKTDQGSFSKTISSSIAINFAGFDLEEEYSNNGSLKNSDSNKNSTGKFDVSKVWYQTFSCQSVVTHYYKNFKIFSPSCGQSNPIYITQRVLRI